MFTLSMPVFKFDGDREVIMLEIENLPPELVVCRIIEDGCPTHKIILRRSKLEATGKTIEV